MKFKNGDKVEIHSTTDDNLDGITGEVKGISFNFPGSCAYIVLLDSRYSGYPWDAISLTEHCLKKIS